MQNLAVSHVQNFTRTLFETRVLVLLLEVSTSDNSLLEVKRP